VSGVEAVNAFAAELAKHDSDTRARMLAQAKLRAVQGAPDSSFEPPIRTLRDYLAAEIEMPPILVEPALVVRGGLNATIGRAGKGKTVLNLNRMLRWSAGLPLFDNWLNADGVPYLQPSGELRILIVENEGAAGMFHQQVGIMVSQEEFLTNEQREVVKDNVLVWGEGGYSGLKLDDPAKLDGLRAGVEKHKPDIVYIEPFRSLWNGEENSATEMAVVTDALVGIATDYECGCIIAHHESKGAANYEEKMSAARGSTVLEGIVTAMENFEPVVGGRFRELSWSKMRHGSPPPQVRMDWVEDAWWYRHVPISEIEGTIIKLLRENDNEPMTVAAFVEATDEKEHALRKRLNKMVDDGVLLSRSSASYEDGRGSTGKMYWLKTGDPDLQPDVPVPI
jgi:hypothetical protein